MKKVLGFTFAVIMVAVIMLGTLIAYDEYKEAKKREIQRIERCEKNDRIFEAELDPRFAQFAIDAFENGYTINVEFTYWKGLTQYECEWSGLNEDDLARLLQNNDYKDMHFTKIEFGHYNETLDSWR